jgi:hypothetical protein
MRARSPWPGSPRGVQAASGSSAGSSIGWPRIGRSTAITRGDERARPLRRLHDQHAGREARNQSIALGKIACARLPAERHLGNERALREDGFREADMLGWIDMIVSSRQYGDGSGRQACPVGAGINAARQARNDRKAGLAKLAREPLGEAHAAGRGIAGADDGNHGQLQHRHIALHGEERRRVADHRQPLRISGLAHGEQAHAERFHGSELTLGVFAWMNARRAGGTAASGKIGQRLECGARTAVMIEEGAERARTDVVAANETQPIELGLVREF